MIMAAKKSQDLKVISWRPRRADGTNSSVETSRLRTQKPVFFITKGKKRLMSQFTAGSEGFLFVGGSVSALFRPSVDWMHRPTLGESNLLYSVF